jgi:hypothetical protein
MPFSSFLMAKIPNSLLRLCQRARVNFIFALGILCLLFAWPGAAAQSGDFSYLLVNGTVMIMNYTGSGGAVAIPSMIDGLAVTSIGERAFSDCTNVISVTIGNSVTDIGDMAFMSCTSLESVTIPNSVTAIGRGAFSNCTNLLDVTIPNGVTSVREGTFHWCTSMTNVTIPGSVTNIGAEAFSVCMSLLSVTIPDRVSFIGEVAFAGCSSLTSVTIPERVRVIEALAFAACVGLTSAFFEGDAPDETLGMFGFNNQLIVYYRYGTTGWGPTFAGRPTSMSPFAPLVESPLDLGVVLGGTTVNLTAHIAGSPAPSFQWFFNDKPVVGATNEVLIVSAASELNAGVYQVIANNDLGSGTNGPATLGVNNVVASNFFGLVIPNAPGTPVQIQSAAEIRGPWTPLADLTLTDGQEVFIDFSATNAARRFYRTTQPGRLQAWLFPGWSFTAPPGTQQKIEYVNASVGFTNWQFLTNLTLRSSPYLFIDTSATNYWPRFYRTTPLP